MTTMREITSGYSLLTSGTSRYAKVVLDTRYVKDLIAGQKCIAEGPVREATPEECKKIYDFVRPPMNPNNKELLR